MKAFTVLSAVILSAAALAFGMHLGSRSARKSPNAQLARYEMRLDQFGRVWRLDRYTGEVALNPQERPSATAFLDKDKQIGTDFVPIVTPTPR